VTIRFYDTATRGIRDFVPLEEGKAGVYLCGLTVQSEPHVGHVRSAVNFDVLRRWLVARGYDVTFIRNITDIDDKILLKAEEQGRPWYNLGYAMRRELDKAYDALNVDPPTYEPAATGHVPEMIELISRLVERGHAYAAEDASGDVYFDVRSWADYGSLTHQHLDDMEAAADADPRGKRDPRDFALWKGQKPGEPDTAAWHSPWGRGRPGWHVECSAMALKYLGGRFDIHGGGVDLRFPHHENEQAQSRAAGFDFASYWLHNAWITTSGEKMSKSLGNSLLVPVVLERVRAIDLRFYIVAAHYRSHVEFSYQALEEAAAGFARIEHFLTRAVGLLDGVPAVADATEVLDALPADFVAAMDDDLGTPAAVAVLYDTVRDGNKLLADGGTEDLFRLAGQVRAMLAVLGLDPFDPHWSAGGSSAHEARLTAAVDSLVGALLERRAAARAAKDFATADAIRDQLKAAGIELEDTPQGPQWSL
jgi:cysteinyl-tRNA synthetase